MRFSLKKISCLLLIFSVPFWIFVPAHSYEKNKSKTGQAKEMTLTDCVFLALRHNRSIKSACLDGVVQKFDLRVDEDEFHPDLAINPSVKHVSVGDGQNRSYANRAEIFATVTQKLQTGAELSFVWDNSTAREIDGNSPDDTYSSSWNLAFNQPLLKGEGITVKTIPLEMARINKQINILFLKSTIMDTVTSAINAYRNFLQAGKQLEISTKSLERAKDLLEVNRALIGAGRMAQVEIVQAQADLADKEFGLTRARNAMEAARYSLLRILDIDKNTMIIPSGTMKIKSIKPDPVKYMAVALNARPDYLQALLNLKVAELNLIAAENNYLWDVSPDGAYGVDATDTPERRHSWKATGNADMSDLNAGVSLNIPFGDLTREERVIRAENHLKKARLALDELTDSIETEVMDAVRDVEMKLSQVGSAQRAREFTERKLELEREKLRTGRSSNFQLVTFHNDLLNARNNELDATISYLNELAAMDRTLGTTLDTWKIDIKKMKED